MECQAVTNKGTRCSRKTEDNYCWQHKISLSLQPEILNNIFSYSRTVNPINKELQTTSKQKIKILRHWFEEIHVKTPFSEVKDSEIPILWGLYQKRIDNAPAEDLLKLAIKNGLNPDYFYSRIFIFRGYVRFLHKNLNDLDADDLDIINDNEDLFPFIWENKARTGDIIILNQYSDIDRFPYTTGNPYNILIYNGKTFDFLEIYDFYNIRIPEKYVINNYPIVTYFKNTLNRITKSGDDKYFNTSVNFNLSELKLELISEQKTDNKFYFTTLYKYKTGEYTIYSFKKNFEKEYLYSDEYEDASDTISLNYDPGFCIDTLGKDTDLAKELIQNQSLKTLYYNA